MSTSYSVIGVKSFRSRNGYGFNASLLSGGRKVALVMDAGEGGCYRWEWLAKDRAQREADAAALAAHVRTLGLGDFEADDAFVAQLVDRWESERRVARQLKAKVFLVLPDQPGVRTIPNVKPTGPVLAQVRARYPQARLLNTMPFAEAFALLSGGAA